MEKSSSIGQIDRALRQLIDQQGALYEGARYSLLSPGKRIRPRLVLTIAQMLGGDQAAALYPACAIEMIHTYSLIHDDLPCMDDDDFRRGKPSLHKVVGEGTAVLVGDFLLTYAFEVLTSAPLLSPEQRLALIQTLSKRGHGMIQGQILDIAGGASREELHARKTGDLFVAAALFGGIVAGADSPVLDKLKVFGEQFGLLFQLVDDLHDKEVTYAEAEEELQSLSQKATAAIEALPGHPEALMTLVHEIDVPADAVH